MLACGRQASPRTPDATVIGKETRTEAQPTSQETSKRHHPIAPNEPYANNPLDDEINDEVDDSNRGTKLAKGPHPFDSMSEAVLREAFEKRPQTLGSVSIGRPNFGQLMNGVQPKESPLYRLVDPSHAWGTQETVESLCHALSVVAQAYPGTPVVDIGHLSAKEGGPLQPHHSHQSGRDVDLGFYYLDNGTRWYTRASRDTLDISRTWALIRTLVIDADIEMILLDRSLQELVESYASSVEKDPVWVAGLFHGDGARFAIVRHSPGHTTHMHLRFFNPIAEQSAKRLANLLPSRRFVRASVNYIVHVARSGDTLQKLAQRYRTTIAAIRQANRMRDFQLFVGHRYNIPVTTVPTAHGSTRLANPRLEPGHTSN